MLEKNPPPGQNLNMTGNTGMNVSKHSQFTAGLGSTTRDDKHLEDRIEQKNFPSLGILRTMGVKNFKPTLNHKIQSTTRVFNITQAPNLDEVTSRVSKTQSVQNLLENLPSSLKTKKKKLTRRHNPILVQKNSYEPSLFSRKDLSPIK